MNWSRFLSGGDAPRLHRVAVVPVLALFVVALATIAFLMQLVRRMSFLPFVIYRIALGVILLALIFWGVPLGAVA